jgi:mRNA interferase MazF
MSTASGKANPSRGEVWTVHLDPIVGHEQAGDRPALIISDDRLNHSPAGLAIVLPITGTDRAIAAHLRVPPREGGLRKPSLIMADQIRTISHKRLGRRLGSVSRTTMTHVEDCLRLVLGLA